MTRRILSSFSNLVRASSIIGQANQRQSWHTPDENQASPRQSGAILALVSTLPIYQTSRLIALVLIVGGIIWWLIQLRSRLIARHLRGRLAERVAERERIARELHDTLLQSLFALMLRMQNAVDRLPPGDSVRDSLCQVLNQSEIVMCEGRERVRDLRSGHHESTGLGPALATFGKQLQELCPVTFELSSDGEVQPVDPAVQDEILLIGREALTNAFRHAGAEKIWVKITYRSNALLLSVNDDGRGIDASVLKAGHSSDHWGLPGMRERARNLRANLHVGPRDGGGTCVTLRVSASIAYRLPSEGLRWPAKLFYRTPK